MTEGILILDKPAGVSSAGAVTRVKHMLPRGVKIGHAGTLDPFATGVLVLLIGRATKLAETIMSQPKCYEADVRLGASTPTLDPESDEETTPGATPPSRHAVDSALRRFVGTIQQVPPSYSALKIRGRRASDLTREGQTPQLAARPVRVDAIELLAYEWPVLRIRVDCGRGTYLRSLARDIGATLGVGGYLTALRRTRVGPYRVEDAAQLGSPNLLSGIMPL